MVLHFRGLVKRVVVDNGRRGIRSHLRPDLGTLYNDSHIPSALQPNHHLALIFMYTDFACRLLHRCRFLTPFHERIRSKKPHLSMAQMGQ